MPRTNPYAEIFKAVSCLDISISEKLSKHFELVKKINPDLGAAYEEMVTTWERAGTGTKTLKPGDRFPDFLLPNEQGNLASLKGFLEKGPLVVSFNRGHWCPYCRHELLDFKRIYPAIQKLGATLVSIMPDRTGFTRPYIENLDLPFQILSDIDQALVLEVGLLAPIGPRVQKLYSDVLGYDLPTYQDARGWSVPVPATFVLDNRGVIITAFSDPDFRKRLPMENILADLKKLKN